MNEIYRPPSLPLTTQAAEGLPRRRWTTAELEEMARRGLFRDARGNDERFELIGGEVVPMSPKGNRHEIVRNGLSRHLTRLCPSWVDVGYEPQFNLTGDTYLLPDLLIWPASILLPDVRGNDVLLLVEVADSSRSYDLTVKALTYAAHGVREYWVIDCDRLETHVHRLQADGTYLPPKLHAASTTLTASLVPELAVKLADIRLA